MQLYQRINLWTFTLDLSNVAFYVFYFFQVVEKFNREGKGTVDFLDFLTYIPLFIDIHENIISDPLNLSRVR